MSERAKALLAEVLQLPDGDRIAVVDGIWHSLPETVQDEFAEVHGPTADPEFRAELLRRLDAVRDHPEELIDGDEAIRQVRARLAEAEQRR